jgi:hypothetical protein
MAHPQPAVLGAFEASLYPAASMQSAASLAFGICAGNPHRRWVGTGDVGSPWINQFLAGQNSTPQTPWSLTNIPLLRSPGLGAQGTEDCRRHPAPRLPRRALQTASRARAQSEEPPRHPIAIVTAESSGRTQSAAVVAFLKQAGCDARSIFQLRDHGILGNGHFIMLESNRRQVFDLIRGWIDENAKA